MKWRSVQERRLALTVTDETTATDARQNLNDWLDYAPKDVDNLLITLQRARKAACVAEPVTAMILEPLIEQTAAVKAKLSELIGLRVKP